MNNENENTNTNTPKKWVSEKMLDTAENAATIRYLFPVRGNSEIGTAQECTINGWNELYKLLADEKTAADITGLLRTALDGATDFNLRPIGWARRSKDGIIAYDGDNAPRGIVTATAFCLWVKIGDNGEMVSDILGDYGIALPATIPLKNGRKYRNRLKKL